MRRQVVEVARGGRFTVCLVGDGEDESTFRETYNMADHGKEWRWPERSKRQRHESARAMTGGCERARRGAVRL